MRSILVFSFFYLIKENNSEIEASKALLEFSSAVFLSIFLIFGQDQMFILKRSKDIPLALIHIRFYVLIILLLGTLLNLYQLSFVLTIVGMALMQEIKSCVKFSLNHKLDAIANIIALLIFLALSSIIQDLSLAFGLSVLTASLPIWYVTVNVVRSVKTDFSYYFKMFVSSILLYAFLNIDWLFFKYSVYTAEFADFTIMQKIALNLTLLASVLGNVTVGMSSSILKKSVLFYYAISLMLAVLIYIFSPLLLLSIFGIGDGELTGIYLYFLALIVFRFVISWLEIPLKRDAGPELRFVISLLMLLSYIIIGWYMLAYKGPIGLVIAMILVHGIYTAYLLYYNSKFSLWSRVYG